MERIHELLKVLVGPETHIHPSHIGLVIAVAHRLKERVKKHAADPELLEVRDPAFDRRQTACRRPVIVPGRPRKSDRINLINNCFVWPHTVYFLSVIFAGNSLFEDGHAQVVVRQVILRIDKINVIAELFDVIEKDASLLEIFL